MRVSKFSKTLKVVSGVACGIDYYVDLEALWKFVSQNSSKAEQQKKMLWHCRTKHFSKLVKNNRVLSQDVESPVDDILNNDGLTYLMEKPPAGCLDEGHRQGDR